MPDPEADYEIDIDWEEAGQVVKAPAPVKLSSPAIAPKADRDLAAVQARAATRNSQAADPGNITGAVVETGDRITFMDRQFRIAERIGLMPLLKFASASDVEVQDPRALAAMYALLRDCIYAGTPGCGDCDECEAGNDTACKAYERGDWHDFEEHAMVTKAEAEDLFEVVNKVLELVSGRPRAPRAGSSPGQRTTRQGSTARGSATSRRGSRR